MLVIVGVKCREGFLHKVPITPVDNTFGYMIADKLGWTPEGRRARRRPITTWRWTVEKDSRNKGGWKSWEILIMMMMIIMMIADKLNGISKQVAEY